ncbi:conserved hypothetical protein [Vibrio chagasii]|nr:conserved hypothetical protein [Vibrio chagasii]
MTCLNITRIYKAFEVKETDVTAAFKVFESAVFCVKSNRRVFIVERDPRMFIRLERTHTGIITERKNTGVISPHE